MPRPLPLQEYVTIPHAWIYRTCEEPIARLNALLKGSVNDYLRVAFHGSRSYGEAVSHAHRVYHDMGRFQGFPDREERQRKAERVMEALGLLERQLVYTIGRAHGIHYQCVDFVRPLGPDAALFRLRPFAITPTPIYDDIHEDTHA